MARKAYIATTHFLVLQILLFILPFLLHNNQATGIGDDREARAEAPTPQAQPNTNTTFPMHGVTPGSLKPQECGSRCGIRCSRTAYKKPCMFFCQKCCATCLCVPPGTYGNKETCPCYNNWKTKRGGPKCP